MSQPDMIDPNDIIKREQHFKELATNFLKTIKLNPPTTKGVLVRTQAEIDECNKVKKERTEDRKDKQRERIFKRKPKTSENKLKMEEFVGNKEFDKIVGRNSENVKKFKANNSYEKKNNEKGNAMRQNRSTKESANVNGDKTKMAPRTNIGGKFAGRFEKFGGNNKKKRLGKSRRAELRDRKTNKNK